MLFDLSPAHVADIMPTILESTGVQRPNSCEGHEMQTLDGESFLPLLIGGAWTRQQPIFFEHEGNCAVRIGEFKLVKEFGRDWELYNIIEDRTELHNLASGDPTRVHAMVEIYDEWASRTGVLAWNILLPRLQKIWQMEDVSQT